jgi:hypothetical protein
MQGFFMSKRVSKYFFGGFLLLILMSSFGAKREGQRSHYYYIDPLGDTPIQGVKNYCYNMFLIVKEVCSADTMLTLTAFTPLYLGARMIDEEVNQGFYDARCHCNVDYPHKCLEFSVHGSMLYPVILMSLFMMSSSDENVRMTGGVALSGIVVTQLVNQAIKHLVEFRPVRAGCRPRNGDFNPNKRVYNGFPSGHALGCAYIAVLCGLRLGPKWAIGVGGICGAIAGLTIQCNRHYASQVIAGAALGTIFAIASNKVIESKLSHSSKYGYEIGLVSNKNGNSCLEAAITF